MKLTLINPRTKKRQHISAIDTSRSSGCECTFFKLNSKVGIKLYPIKERALLTKRNQIAYWKKGMAPKVLSIVFKIKRPDREGHYWGYFTEVAKTPVENNEGYKFWNKLIKNSMSSKDLPDFIDRHNGNLGKIGRKIVAIDFGMGFPQ